MTRTARPEWYRQWFGEEYLALYPHRDVEEARRAVNLVLGTGEEPDGLVLDLACGAGRHLAELDSRGVEAVGLDLSATLLAQANARHGALRLVQGDMRDLPFAPESFYLVANFFTSFGYFSDPDEDAKVLQEIRRVVRPGGRFALDFLNADRVRAGIVPRDERELEGRRVIQTRNLEDDGRVVAKVIEIHGTGRDAPIQRFEERVRLYSTAELRAMLEAAGFRTERTLGDYSGAALGPESPRCILLGRAE